MIYIICAVHGVHRVCETIRLLCPTADALISNGKKILLKAPLRVSQFCKMWPEISLPPQPIVTRWGSWISAAHYLLKHLESFEAFPLTSDSEDAAAIAMDKLALDNKQLISDLAIILSNFSDLPLLITKLESSSSLLVDSLNTLSSICRLFLSMRGKGFYCFVRNYFYKLFCTINKVKDLNVYVIKRNLFLNAIKNCTLFS